MGTWTLEKTPAEKPLIGVLINIFWSINAQAHISTQDPEARASARFSPAHVQRRWTTSFKKAETERPYSANRPQQCSREARSLVRIQLRVVMISARAKAGAGETRFSPDQVNRYKEGAAFRQVLCPPTCCVICAQIGRTQNACRSERRAGGG
jgi:hypothetical protein